MNSKKFAQESIGWLGVILVLLAYGLLSLDLIKGNSILYHSLFLSGSLGLATITFIQRAWQPFTLNIVFVILAMIALIRLTILA